MFTVATDELRAQNVHRTLDESLNEDFVFTREKFRFPGLFPRPLERRMRGLSHTTLFLISNSRP